MRNIAANRALSAASKTAVAALALSLLAGPASAAALCARPQDMTALRAAALRQELMVAALTCHAVADFNLFVTTYREELLKSDRDLKEFFLRQDASKAEDAYNAYKTRLANVSSLRSLHDPQFCRSAKVSFDVALKRKGALEELASVRPSPVATGYAICSPDATKTMTADAAPSQPARRLASLDSPSSVPVPKLAPRPLRASPPQRVAALVEDGAPTPAPLNRIVADSLPQIPGSKIAAPRGRAMPKASPQRVASLVADAAPSPAPLHRVVADSLPPVPAAKMAAPRDRVLTQASPQRVAEVAAPPRANADRPRLAEQLPAREPREIDADDGETDARIADGERDDIDNDAADERDGAGDDAPRYEPRYAPRYAEAQPPRAYGRSNGYSNGYNNGYDNGYGNGPYANDSPGAYRDTDDAPYGNVPDAYKPHAYWVNAYEPPARPRMVRGPYGRWYLLMHFGR